MITNTTKKKNTSSVATHLETIPYIKNEKTKNSIRYTNTHSHTHARIRKKKK